MSILSIQKRFRKLGNIRIGTKHDRGFPTKLDTFRFTSRTKGYVQQIADKWGGEVQPWGDQWEVITKVSEVPVMVPPQDPDNMTWYELWGQSGQQRKCDEETDRRNNVPCQCNPENRDCTLITRLTVILPDIEGVGVWLLSSTGWNAAQELNTAVETIFNYMRRTGEIPPARLILEQREVKRPGEATKQFAVPVLAIDLPMGDVLELGRIGPPEAPGGALPESVDTNRTTMDDLLYDPLVGTPNFTGLTPEEALTAQIIDIDPELESKKWDELFHLLEHTDTVHNKTIPELKTSVRLLYQLMEQLGLWPEGSLELNWLTALKKAGKQRSHPSEVRLGDLGPKKDGLLGSFATHSFKRAQERLQENQ